MSPKERMEVIKNLPDDEIDYSDIPEFKPEQVHNIRIEYPDGTVIPLELKIDRELFNWFLKRAKGNNYQALMIEALESFKKRSQSESK